MQANMMSLYFYTLKYNWHLENTHISVKIKFTSTLDQA